MNKKRDREEMNKKIPDASMNAFFAAII